MARLRLGLILAALWIASEARAQTCVATEPTGTCGPTTRVQIVCDTRKVCTCEGVWVCTAASGEGIEAAGNPTEIQFKGSNNLLDSHPSATIDATNGYLSAPMGAPTDGVWTTGLLGFVVSTLIKDAIDDIDETLAVVAPADALSMDAAALTTSGTTFGTACELSFGAGTYDATRTAGSGPHSNYCITDAIFDVLSPVQATTFNKADLGSLNWLINGGTNDTFSLSGAFIEGNRATGQTYPSACSCPTNACCGAADNLEIDSVGPYNSFPAWQKGNAHALVVAADLIQGHNELAMSHTGITSTQTTAETWVFYDNDAGANPACVAPTVASVTPATVYRSGVPHYGLNSTFNLSWTCSDLFDNVHHESPVLIAGSGGTTNVASISITDGAALCDVDTCGSGTAGQACTNGNSKPAVGNNYCVTNKLVTMATASQTTSDLRFTVTPRDPFASYSPATSAAAFRLLDTYATSSTIKRELLEDENRRLPRGRCSTDTDQLCQCSTGASCDGEAPACPGAETCVYDMTFTLCPETLTGQWTSSYTMPNGEAQVYLGTLRYPAINFAGYLPAGPNYAGFTGTSQVYYRAFTDAGIPHSSGVLELDGLVDADVGIVGSGAVNVELKVCGGVTGWLDLGKAFSGTAENDGDGAKVSVSGDLWSWTIGTNSTIDNSIDGYILRVTFRNATRTINEIEETAW